MSFSVPSVHSVTSVFQSLESQMGPREISGDGVMRASSREMSRASEQNAFLIHMVNSPHRCVGHHRCRRDLALHANRSSARRAKGRAARERRAGRAVRFAVRSPVATVSSSHVRIIGSFDSALPRVVQVDTPFAFRQESGISPEQRDAALREIADAMAGLHRPARLGDGLSVQAP
jgi:hypothetical protein